MSVEEVKQDTAPTPEMQKLQTEYNQLCAELGQLEFRKQVALNAVFHVAQKAEEAKKAAAAPIPVITPEVVS